MKIAKHSLLAIAVPAVAALVLLVSPAPAMAQCYDHCGSCAIGREGGWGQFDLIQGYDFDCLVFCEDCWSPLVADADDAATAAAAISQAGPSDVSDVLRRYEGRVYIHPERNLLAVTGVGCSGESYVDSVVFLSRDAMARLSVFDLPRLEDFLSRAE